MDAADFGLIGRPRMWWSRLEWKQFQVNPINGSHLRWGKHHGYPRLYIEAPLDSIEDMYLDGFCFHPKIIQQVCRLPCLTTPAPDDSGRSAPKKSKQRLDQETRNRWLSANRQYAPWHYQEHALMTSPSGDIVTPPIQVKEQLHHLEYDFTWHPSADDRARHRMLGNSWHKGVVKFLLLFLLQCSQTTAIPSSPQMSTLQLVCSWASTSGIYPGPPMPSVHHLDFPPCGSMEEHWQAATQTRFPSLVDRPMSDLATYTAHLALSHLGDLTRLREEVLQDIQDMINDWQDHTNQWWNSRPPHIQKVYWHAERHQVTQIPVMVELLQQCQFPGIDDLAEDLHWGFETVGELHPGCGWLPRLDERYASPLELSVFHRVNKRYVLTKLRQNYVDEHWQPMLDEILEDRSKGRLEGPFEAPEDWPRPSVAPPGEALLKLPDKEMFAAFCFSVSQHDKIRRCEDYRRSHHNETVCVKDIPHHDTIDAYARLAFWWLSHQDTPVAIWAHDLDSAYRQIGVRRPQYAYVVLQTPSGPMIFRHTAMCFGATASVWGFNRFADSMLFLFHHLFLSTTLHFVDDFGGVEPATTALSAFSAFDGFFSSLGLHMKKKKAEPPSPHQRLLGVIIEVEQGGVRLSPCPERVAKIQEVIQSALASNSLSPESAQKLAGKLVFLQSTAFGRLGTAATHCLYSRAQQGAVEFNRLTQALEASLLTLADVLQHLRPRWLPLHRQDNMAAMYTDAFFAPGDSLKDTKKFSIHTMAKADNGWGFVVTSGHHTFYSFGKIPSEVVKVFGTRRAFIYLLEAVTPLITLVLLKDLLPSQVLSFVDNQASLQALKKGYGRDASINGLLCLFWSLITRLGIEVAFEWVPSHLNISDPISRRDVHLAEEHVWKFVPPTLEKFYKILVRCSRDLHYAAGQGATDCLALPSILLASDLVQSGYKGPEMVKKWPFGFDGAPASMHTNHCQGEKGEHADPCSSQS